MPHGKPPIQTQHEEEIEDSNMSLQDTSSNIRLESNELNGSEQSSSAVIREVENLDLIDKGQRSEDTYKRTEITDNFLQDQFMEDGYFWYKKPKQRMLEKEEWHDHNQRDMPVDIQSWNTGDPRTSSANSSSSCDDQDRHDKY